MTPLSIKRRSIAAGACLLLGLLSAGLNAAAPARHDVLIDMFVWLQSERGNGAGE